MLHISEPNGILGSAEQYKSKIQAVSMWKVTKVVNQVLAANYALGKHAGAACPSEWAHARDLHSCLVPTGSHEGVL